MRRKELARHLDLMSDELSENEPDLALAMESGREVPSLLHHLLPGEAEITAMRVGAIIALVWAQDALVGEVEPGDPVRDARELMGHGLTYIFADRLGIAGGEGDRHE